MSDDKYKKIIENIICSDDTFAKVGLARNCNADEEILKRLMDENFDNGHITTSIAEGCAANPDILIKLMSSHDFKTRAAAARYCDGNTDVLNIAVTDEHPLVREWAAKSSNGNINVLNALKDDMSLWVKVAVAKSCNGDKRILQRLYDDATKKDDVKPQLLKAVKKEMKAYNITPSHSQPERD